MVESVDTRDLKSLGHCGCAGSSPASSTGKMLCKSMIYGAFSFLYAGLDLFLLHSVYAFLGLTVKPKVKLSFNFVFAFTLRYN